MMSRRIPSRRPLEGVRARSTGAALLVAVVLTGGYLATGTTARAVGPRIQHGLLATPPISGASQAICTPSPCRQGPPPVSSPHGAVTVRADDGTGTVIDRYYSVYRPAGLTNSPTNKAPAVLAFGRAGACGPGEISRLYNESRLQPIADANRFIVVYMSTQTAGAPKCAWHHPAIDIGEGHDPLDDEPYVTAVIRDILGKENVDPLRIYATGGSSGGAMVQAVACDPTNSTMLRGISAVSEFMPVAISAGQSTGDPHCSSSNRNLFVQLQAGTADPNVPYNGICLASHCLASFSATLDFWRRHLGCTTANTTTVFGSPQQANRQEVFTHCAYGTNYGVEGVTVQNGLHTYSGLNDSLNGAVSTNGFVPGQSLWEFFSSGQSASTDRPAAVSAQFTSVRVTGRGARRQVELRIALSGPATISAALLKGSRIVAAKLAHADRGGKVALQLKVGAKAPAGPYTVRVRVRGSSGGSVTIIRSVTVPA